MPFAKGGELGLITPNGEKELTLEVGLGAIVRSGLEHYVRKIIEGKRKSLVVRLPDI